MKELIGKVSKSKEIGNNSCKLINRDISLIITLSKIRNHSTLVQTTLKVGLPINMEVLISLTRNQSGTNKFREISKINWRISEINSFIYHSNLKLLKHDYTMSLIVI